VAHVVAGHVVVQPGGSGDRADDLTRWAMHKFKRFRGKYAKAMAWLQKIYQYKPGFGPPG